MTADAASRQPFTLDIAFRKDVPSAGRPFCFGGARLRSDTSSDEKVEHLHPGEVTLEGGSEFVEKEVKDKDDAKKIRTAVEIWTAQTTAAGAPEGM